MARRLRGQGENPRYDRFIWQMGVDFGKTAKEYGRYCSDLPDAFFERLSTFGIGRRGQLVLDLGTGTGSLARGLALRGCEVTGIDVSESMLEEARRPDREADVPSPIRWGGQRGRVCRTDSTTW